MPRQITDHIVEGDSANHQLGVLALDEPGQGNACHLYQIYGFETGTNVSNTDVAGGPHESVLAILFQNGPIKEVGVNGVTHEALIAVLMDRLRGFQSGPYACQDNAEALHHLSVALGYLQKRTKARIARGVEGTNEK